jgi:hypothetical protein
MNTVAHDDAGRPAPACTWEVFRTADGTALHITTISACSLLFEKGCVLSLDEGSKPREPLFCFEPTRSGALTPQPLNLQPGDVVLLGKVDRL